MLEGGCSERSLCWACMPLSWELWTKTHSQKYLLTLSGTKIRTVALKNWHFKKTRVRAGGGGERFLPKGFFFFLFFLQSNNPPWGKALWACSPGPLYSYFPNVAFFYSEMKKRKCHSLTERNHVWLLSSWPLCLWSPNVDFSSRHKGSFI